MNEKRKPPSPDMQLATLEGYLQQRKTRLVTYMKGRDSKLADRMIALAVSVAQEDERIRVCDPKSLWIALKRCARYNLTIGSDSMAESYIWAVKNGRASKIASEQAGREVVVYEALWVPSYRGLIKVVTRSKRIRVIRPRCVYASELDQFEILFGSEDRIVHRPCLEPAGPGETASIVGAYSIATLDTGEKDIYWMHRTEIEKVRWSGRAPHSLMWETWWDQGACKTAIRRQCKTLVFDDPEAEDLLDYEAKVDAGKEIADDEDEPERVEVRDITKTEELAARAKRSTLAKQAKQIEQQEAETMETSTIEEPETHEEPTPEPVKVPARKATASPAAPARTINPEAPFDEPTKPVEPAPPRKTAEQMAQSLRDKWKKQEAEKAGKNGPPRQEPAPKMQQRPPQENEPSETLFEEVGPGYIEDVD